MSNAPGGKVRNALLQTFRHGPLVKCLVSERTRDEDLVMPSHRLRLIIPKSSQETRAFSFDHTITPGV